jgi:eukaryotic-like serine/threonine-protein kinase
MPRSMPDADERPGGHAAFALSSPTIASARVSHELIQPGTFVGRYRIVEKVASGGMGVVYRAYDPELSRHVALKLVLESDVEPLVAADEYEQRLLREAQALARLSHPNVVAAFDVGRFAGALFIAMELIDGVSLRAWLQGQRRTRAEIMRMLLDAGRGLSAAHRAGVIHRDFKLSNVMVSAEGRVLVVDFGLARTMETSLAGSVPDLLAEPALWVDGQSGTRQAISSGELTRTGAIVGTAGYIAPEQFEGGMSDERSDQFSYAASAFRALTGASPYPADSLATNRTALLRGERAAWPPSVPRRIRKVIDRGLSRLPQDRFPSLDAMLEELERATRPPRRLTLLVVTALGLSALAATLALRDRLSKRCDVDTSSFDRVWDAEQAERVEAAFRSSGNPRAGDTFALIASRLDEYRSRWQAAKQDACVAVRVRREQSEQILSLRNACLDSKVVQLGAIVGLLQRADAKLVDRAPEALDSVARVRDCADVAALVGESERLPDDPARRAQIRELQSQWDTVQATFAAGGWPELLERARALAQDAESVGYKPIQARAMSLTVSALERLGRWDEVPALRERTLQIAAEARVEDVLGYQALRLLLLAVDGERMGEAKAMLPLVEADVRLAGDEPAQHIRLLTYQAAISTADGDFGLAVEKLTLALSECRQLGREGLRSCLTPQRELGILYAARKDYAAARRELEAAVELARQAFGRRHPNVINENNNLADILVRAGEFDAAARAVEESKALAATLPESRQTASIPQLEGLILQGRGDLEGALPFLERAAERLAAAYGLESMQASLGQYLLGNCLWNLGRAREAVAHLTRALELRRNARAPARSIAEAAFGLADALWPEPAERARSSELAREALALFQADGQSSIEDCKRVAAWLDAHPPSRATR